MNSQIGVAYVQYAIAMLCFVIAIKTKRPVDWLITFSWFMTATLWFKLGIDEANKVTKVMVQLDDGAFMPRRAHDTDAGADIFSPVCFRVPARGSYTVNTGVHVQLPPNTKCDIRSKSGLNIKSDIVTDGLVDEGYSGAIMVKLYNMGDNPKVFKRGDKITQMVITPVLYTGFKEVDVVHGGERGDNGIGSTGR